MPTSSLTENGARCTANRRVSRSGEATNSLTVSGGAGHVPIEEVARRLPDLSRVENREDDRGIASGDRDKSAARAASRT